MFGFSGLVGSRAWWDLRNHEGHAAEGPSAFISHTPTCQMPKAKEPKEEKPYGFYFNEKAAALIQLLRHCDLATFHKFCPDISNAARSGLGADDILLSLFGAMHGDLKQICELPAEGKKDVRLRAAWELCPKVGRPRREVALRLEAEKLAAAAEEERRRKHVNSRMRQRHITTPAGLEPKCHLGGFTTRGNKVEPVKDAAIVSVCPPA